MRDDDSSWREVYEPLETKRHRSRSCVFHGMIIQYTHNQTSSATANKIIYFSILFRILFQTFHFYENIYIHSKAHRRYRRIHDVVFSLELFLFKQ